MSWLAFSVLCAGALMTVVDGTVVVVALPSIGSSLDISSESVVGVANAYTAASGGFLLCSGKLGDLFGLRRLFFVGVVLFTLASVGCAFSTSYHVLIGFRVLQGLSGAAVTTATYSSAVAYFPEVSRRARALSLLSFIATMGSIVGVLLGGVLTESLSWRWVFLINIPIGIGVCSLSFFLMERRPGSGHFGLPDFLGGAFITLSLILFVLAIQGLDQDAGLSEGTIFCLVSAGLLALAHLWIERRVASPTTSFSLLQVPNFALCCIISVLSSLVGVSDIFVSMYLQMSLHDSPGQVSVIFLVPSLIGAIFFLGISTRIVATFGIKAPLVTGLAVGSAGLLVLAQASAMGLGVYGYLVGLVIATVGVGVCSTPNLVAATGDVTPEEAGRAAGVLATATMMAGAIGLALLAGLFAAVESHGRTAGALATITTNRGYQWVFLACAISNALAIPFALRVRRAREPDISYERAL